MRDVGQQRTDRLRELARWCVTGRLSEAELELSAWCRRSDCPPAARVMLAALLARRGRTRQAIDVIGRLAPADVAADPHQAQMLITLLTTADFIDAARRLAVRVEEAHGGDETVMSWLRAMGVPGHERPASVSGAVAEHLAAELHEWPQLVASLVAAQKHEPNPRSVELLRRAVSRIVDDEDENKHRTAGLCLALAELALLAEDEDDARRWAHRGLTHDPYNAALALVLTRVREQDGMGPPTREVLGRVVKHHPGYADVRAALIRRHYQDGQAETARLELRHWLEREPQSPIARGLERELAA